VDALVGLVDPAGGCLEPAFLVDEQVGDAIGIDPNYGFACLVEVFLLERGSDQVGVRGDAFDAHCIDRSRPRFMCMAEPSNARLGGTASARTTIVTPVLSAEFRVSAR